MERTKKSKVTKRKPKKIMNKKITKEEEADNKVEEMIKKYNIPEITKNKEVLNDRDFSNIPLDTGL